MMSARPLSWALRTLFVAALFSTASAQTATYCVAAPNSEGPGAQIGWAGSLSVADNSFILNANGAIPNQYGRFVFGPTRYMKPAGDGFTCLKVSRFRFPMGLANTNGVASYRVDFTSPPHGAPPVMAGTILYFQYEYRDPTGPGGRTFNFSNGLRVEFQP